MLLPVPVAVADRDSRDRPGPGVDVGEGGTFPREAHEEPAQHGVLVGVRCGRRNGPLSAGEVSFLLGRRFLPAFCFGRDVFGVVVSVRLCVCVSACLSVLPVCLVLSVCMFASCLSGCVSGCVCVCLSVCFFVVAAVVAGCSCGITSLKVETSASRLWIATRHT